MVSSTPRPYFTPGKEPVPILQKAGWAPGPVWTVRKSRPHRDSIPDRPARSQSLHRLSYPVNHNQKLLLLTPWCRVLFEKLTGLQLVKEFPAFHGNRRFITALTSVRHLSLSWARPIQSIYPHPSSWRSILILSTHLRLGLPSGIFPSIKPRLMMIISFPVVLRSNAGHGLLILEVS